MLPAYIVVVHMVFVYSIVPAVALMLYSNVDLAFAQAGSTGGSIGKQEKSVSGGEDAAPARRPAKAAKPRESTSRSSRGASIVGTWRWWADCERNVKHFAGTMTFTDIGGGYAGTHGGSNFFDGGTISNIRFGGNRLTFTRQFANFVDHLNLTVSGSSMRGVLPNTEYSGRCNVSASRM